MDDARIAAGCMDQPGKLARFRSSLVYDAVMRLPLAIWFAICASAVGQRLYADVAAAPVVDAKLVLDVAARVSGIAFILIIILALSVRLPAIARSAGVLPRVVAFCGTFSLTALALFDPVPHSLPVAIASLVFMCVGYAFACYTLVHLGRSLSMMAEARKLVTSGPYAIVRHPLYAAEAIASFGLLLQYLSIETVALWLFHLALQLWRITYEEKILRQTFPEYADYSLRVSRLLPST